MLLAESLLGTSSVAANFIEDVFSTYLYTGTGASRTITNDIDLSGKGGMVWFKSRTNAAPNALFDTARGANISIRSNSASAQENLTPLGVSALTSFTSTGFQLGDDVGFGAVNTSPNNYVSWTFRKQVKFFDVVTYTGSGVETPVNHSLGSVPGFYVVKRINSAGNWLAYHRSLTTAEMILLNSTAGATGNNMRGAAPTATQITPAGDADINGATYVAYLFAHDAGGFGATGADNVISCGSLTGPSQITLGYEPQWVLLKKTNDAQNWFLFDNMRGMSLSDDLVLIPNTTGAEVAVSWITPTSTGFSFDLAGASDTYIYIAIRRGPMRTPTTGTSVFSPVTYTGNNASTRTISSSITVDSSWIKPRWAAGPTTVDRLRGGGYIRPNTSSPEDTTTTYYPSNPFSTQTGVIIGDDADGNGYTNTPTQPYINWQFRRAPGFFDVVCYTGGTGSPRVLNHNLGAVPELLITKIRNFTGEDWVVHYNNGSSIIGGLLNNTAAFANSSTIPSTDVTSFTSTTYTLNTTNRRVNGAYNYVAYLFATVAGVSKVGSYTGTGTTQQINCGFTAGARFVLIKRTDDVGDWYVWDSARGIVAGNDPYILLNSAAAEVTSTDYVDTYSAGFEISGTAPADINANGGSFVFLAIA